MSVSHWQADGSQPVRDVDFLVVGAGLVGCTAAYFAAQGGRDVVITDQADIALGASGRNAGFMITGLDTYYHRAIERYGHDVTRQAWALSQETHRIWHDFAERGNVRLDRCGSLLLAESAAERDELRTAIDAMHADNLPAIYHDSDPLRRGYLAAIEQPDDCAVHPVALTRAIFAASGAELIANNELYHIAQADDGAVLVYTRRFIFRAAHVLLCTNAYSPRIHPYFVGKVTPTRAQVFVTEPLAEPLLKPCGYSDYGYMYYRMTFDNRFLIGGGRHQHKSAEDDTTEDRINDAVQATLTEYCRRYFPEIFDADGTPRISRRWAGIMGFTPDGLPLVGRLPDMPRVGFAVGFTGHGLALGAGTAKRAVAHLLDDADAGFLNAERLADR
ncbi:MAG: FAD-binding oxidoreductase [Anaerolineaceae bacterium]|nr:MAG: FAD-binding oxidoreductase [Anaerolineaceae bacterium]